MVEVAIIVGVTMVLVARVEVARVQVTMVIRRLRVVMGWSRMVTSYELLFGISGWLRLAICGYLWLWDGGG